MLLFILSFILVFAASFFLTALFENKNFIVAFIYCLLIAFANIVFTFEFLSLFSAISVSGVLFLNLLVFVLSLMLWIKKEKPVFNFTYRQFFRKLYAALKTDKYLPVMLFGVIFMLVVSAGLILLSPVVNPDAQAYHVLRSLLWVFDKKIFQMCVILLCLLIQNYFMRGLFYL